MNLSRDEWLDMDNPLLAALQENYGNGDLEAEDDLTTVRGLLAYCKRWLNCEVEASDLHDPCFRLSAQLKAAASATEAKLKANPNMVSEMSAPIRRTADAFIAIASILEELPSLAEQELGDDFLDALDEFEEQRQAVLDSQAIITRQIGGATALCQGCGSGGDEAVCPNCSLTRLYPDPKAGKRDGHRANLAGVYVRVFRSYQGVIQGKQDLSQLVASLDPLEAHLRTLTQLGQSLRHSPEVKEAVSQEGTAEADTLRLLRKLEPEIHRALSGVERLRGVRENRLMSELHRGWDDIFDSAVMLEGSLKELGRKHGLQNEERPTRADSVTISGE